MPLPLEGYTVLDLTRARSGPTAVRQLADMGANVIKIEAREEMEGDSTALGFDFLNLHRNKRSMTLDLKSPRGIEINAREIANLGRELHKRVSDSAAHLGKLGRHIEGTVRAYNDTVFSA